jgi:dipeptidyl aminopeptidase/acylaminoacyl peptidase
VTLPDPRRQVALGQIALSPDGEQVVYTRRTSRGDSDQCGLMLVRYRGGRPAALTTATHRDHTPRFSPDGRLVAFLSDRTGTTQLYLISPDGGEARAITTTKRGVLDYDWAPDSRRLVILTEDQRSPNLVGERDGREPTARVIRRIDWRWDNDGFTLHPRHLHIVSTSGRRPRRLTSGRWSASQPRVAPDGTRVAFLADADPDADRRDRARITLVPFAGGDPVMLDAPPGPVTRIAWDADGTLVCIGRDRFPFSDADPDLLFAIQPDGSHTRLSPPDAWVSPGADATDLADWQVTVDFAGRVCSMIEHGRAVACRFDDAGPVRLAANDTIVFALAQAASRAVAIASIDAPPAVYALEHGRARLLCRERRWFASRQWPRLDERIIAGPGGAIRTFIFSPHNGSHAARATILNIHGGPTGQWHPLPLVETLMLVARGYRVVQPNIRGSTGEGRAWVAALNGGWGSVDAEDCHAVLDALVADGTADPDRLGVMGLSYGGFLVNWLVATSNRFAAAVSENGVTNQVSSWANSDSGPVYCVAAGLGDTITPAGVATLWRQSPLAHVAAVTTPLLLLQAEQDHRCPAADAEQFFVALRWLGRDVEYVLYPESAHAFCGTARPDRRADRQHRIVDWFGRHVPV